MVTAAIAAVVTRAQPTQYDSTTTLVVQTSAGANDTETLVRTMIALVDSDVVGESLRQRVDSSRSAGDIANALTVERPPGSSVLAVTYSDGDRARSLATAQAFIPVFDEQVAGLEAGQAGQLAPNYAIQPWGNGAVITSSAAPPILRNALIAGLLGLVVGGIGAFLYRQRRPLITDSRDAEAATSLPVLVAPGSLGAGSRGKSAWHPTDVMDAVLAGLPGVLGSRALPRRILVASTESGRQRSSFVTQLARAMEQGGLDAVLVDGDLETGQLSRQLGLSRAQGLADCLRSDLAPTDAIVVPEDGPGAGLSVLPAGQGLPMRSGSAAVALSGLEVAGRLIVDAPPLSGKQSLGPLLRSVDAVVLVVSAGHTSASGAAEASALIRSLRNIPAATVLLSDRADASAHRLSRSGPGLTQTTGAASLSS